MERVTRTALVTGGRGLLGRVVGDSLRSHGWDVVVHSGRDDGDLTQSDAVSTALAVPNLSVVVNAAGIAYGTADEHWLANTIVPMRLAEGLATTGRPVRLVIISSAAVYGLSGAAGHRFKEDGPLEPRGDYATSKIAAERLARVLHPNTVIARVFNLITDEGEGDPRGLLRRIRSGFRDGDIEPDGAADIRDWIAPMAAAEAIAALSMAADPPDVMNVCTGTGRSAADVLGHAAHAAPRSFSVGDPSRLQQLLLMQQSANVTPRAQAP